MKTVKRILLGLGIFLALVIVALFLAPIIFKDRIVATIKSGINESVNAEVDFRDANVSFLRSFPDIALTVDDYHVIGIDTFAGLPLVKGKQARVDLGFWSVIAGDGNYKIDGVSLEQPDINLLVLSPELANYLIVPEDTLGGDAGAVPAQESNLLITLQEFVIENGGLVYDDRTTGTYVKLEGLDATGYGDFTASVFDVTTDATARAFTFGQAGLTYLDEAALDAEATINIDADAMRYTFKDNRIRINELALVFGGSIDLEENDDILMDLTYAAPANDFRQLWSIIPAAYTEGFDQVQTGGTFTLSGTAEGTFNSEKEIYPAFTVDSDISGGSVQYPGRPVGITGIDAALAINSPGSTLNQMVVELPRFNFDLGGDPFRGSFRLATPLTDPDIDARLDGAIDLGKWSSAIPLEGVSELSGRIVTDITANNVRQSTIDAGRYGEVDLTGDVLISNLVYAAEGLPPVRIAQARADFTPRFVDLQQFTATLGRSDISASGKIDNVLAYFSPEQTMRGSVTMQSNFFDADEWMEEDADTTVELSPAELNVAESAAATEETGAEVFDRFDFDVDAEIQELAYATYRPSDLKVVGNIKPNRLEIATAEATLEESSFSGSGVINNLFDYTFQDGVLTGDLSVRSGYFNVDDFMPEESSTATPATTDNNSAPAAAAAAIPVPRNINLKVDMAADRVQYTDINMNEVSGRMLIRDGAVIIENGKANLLGGSMGFTGSYDTAEEDEPGFHFSYDMQRMDFGQAFGALNTFASLAPVGKFISGTFSSELVMEGKLGQDLLPKLASLDANGLIRTAEARLASFKPLQTIGNALNVNELKNSTTIKDLIAPFHISNGTVTVDPFDFQLAGIPMRVGGKHGLDMDMEYRIRAAVPRNLIEGNVATGAALGALDQLAGQASKLGLNISPGDTLNLNIGLTGSIGTPRVAFDLLGTDGGRGGSAAGNTVEAVKEQVKEKVQAELDAKVDSVRTVAGDVAKDVEDSLRSVAEAQSERLQKQAANELKGALGLPKDSTTQGAKDSLALPGAAKDAVDDVKKELEKFNPFRRKKGGG